MIASKRAIRAKLRELTNMDVTADAISYIQESLERYLRLLIESALDVQERNNAKLQVVKIPPEKRLHTGHLKASEREILRRVSNA